MAFSEAVKFRVRRKAHHRCCICRPEKAASIDVHHIIPQEEGGPDTEDNAAPLCPTCHDDFGANPQKRKIIREARDHWYELCEQRYAADPTVLDEIKGFFQNTISYADLQNLKEEVISRLTNGHDMARTESEVSDAISELFDKVWYNRHWNARINIEAGVETVDPEIWKSALEAARKVEEQYGKGELGPWSDFEWGMINGKLSALRWILGDEWDMLDT